MTVESWLKLIIAIGGIIISALKVYVWWQKRKIRKLKTELENQKQDLKKSPDFKK